MRYVLTLNMPVRAKNPGDSPQLVHQIMCEYPAKDEIEFLNCLNDNAFIVVEELYRDLERGGYFPIGMVVLNTNMIGKVKQMTNSNKVEGAREKHRS